MAKRLAGLVVDGYNAIRACRRYSELVDEEILDPLQHDVYQRARQALIADVAAYAKGRYDATIVFDGFGNLDPEREDIYVAGVRIMFSEAGEEADAVIERLVSEGRRSGRRMTVVTSDNLIQTTVYGEGVTRISSRMFEGETQVMNRHIEEMRELPKDRKTTVADRVPRDIRQRMWEMARARSGQ